MRRNNSLQFRISRYVKTHNTISEFVHDDDDDGGGGGGVRSSNTLLIELPSQQ